MVFRFSGVFIRFQNVFQNPSEHEIYRTYFKVQRSFYNLLEIPDGDKQHQRAYVEVNKFMSYTVLTFKKKYESVGKRN